MLTLKFKRLHPDAKLPTKAHAGDAGWDLYAIRDCVVLPGEIRGVLTGIASEVDPGWYCQVRDRSSVASRGLTVLAGVIDCSYRGPWAVVFANAGREVVTFKAGDRIAQFTIHPVPEAEVVEAEELSDSERGIGGFGSTDAYGARQGGYVS